MLIIHKIFLFITSSAKSLDLDLRDRYFEKFFIFFLNLSYSASSNINYFTLLMPALSLQVRPYNDTLYFSHIWMFCYLIIKEKFYSIL